MNQSAYEVLKKKHGLPDFSVLDCEFEISLIEDENFILRSICKKMREKVETSIDLIERVLQPDPNCYSDLYEHKFFRGSDKDALLVLFKELMHIHRAILELELRQDDSAYALFIKQFYSGWQELKNSLLPFISKLKLAWKESKQDKEKLDYLG